MVVVNYDGNFFYPYIEDDEDHRYDVEGWYGREIKFTTSCRVSFLYVKSYEYEEMVRLKDTELEN